MQKLSLVCPVYFNEGSLPGLYKALSAVEQQLLEEETEMEWIFVDDGSRDNSWAELLEIKRKRPATRIIRLTRNFGAIHSAKTGYQFVTGDCFTMVAADLQDPPELLQQMLEKWKAGRKYVICVRENREDPVGSRLFSWFYYFLVRLFVIRDFPKGGYDLALWDKVFLPYMQESSKHVNSTIFAYWLGFKPAVIHYTRRKRRHGKSRWTFAKKFNYFLDSILGFSILPLRIMSMVGWVVSVVSFAYGLWIGINALLGNVGEAAGFSTIVTLVSLLLGLIITMLGMIGEYLWRIFDEVNKRPEYVIDEIH